MVRDVLSVPFVIVVEDVASLRLDEVNLLQGCLEMEGLSGYEARTHLFVGAVRDFGHWHHVNWCLIRCRGPVLAQDCKYVAHSFGGFGGGALGVEGGGSSAHGGALRTLVSRTQAGGLRFEALRLMGSGETFPPKATFWTSFWMSGFFELRAEGVRDAVEHAHVVRLLPRCRVRRVDQLHLPIA